MIYGNMSKCVEIGQSSRVAPQRAIKPKVIIQVSIPKALTVQ
jgi:hypothetical protein